MREYQMRDLLCAVLECGIMDLRNLENCSYEMSELVGHLEELGMDIHLNNLTWAMFDKAFAEVRASMDERIENFADDLAAGAFDGNPAEKERIEDIVDSDLNIEEDVETYFNYLDTHVTLTENVEIYREFFQQDLDMFEELTGYEISC